MLRGFVANFRTTAQSEDLNTHSGVSAASSVPHFSRALHCKGKPVLRDTVSLGKVTKLPLAVRNKYGNFQLKWVIRVQLSRWNEKGSAGVLQSWRIGSSCLEKGNTK